MEEFLIMAKDYIVNLSVFISAVVIIFKFFSPLGKKIESVTENNDKIPDIEKSIEEHKVEIAKNSELIEQTSEEVMSLKPKIDDLSNKAEKEMDLLLCLSRDKLLYLLEKTIDDRTWGDHKHYIVAKHLYDSYVNAGGNTEILSLWDIAKNLPIE